ncbi:uncharacterized protein LOC124989290 [Sciurus carolinensis]|uniref:uncharacterized protein LOC124989290 n=1 Tax=Sciurus carolinensis TaxID=30640 RepID=UPI001FB2CBD2|nr:uncharacterized protein LOC124989290 [Sciurus carolinensis]
MAASTSRIIEDDHTDFQSVGKWEAVAWVPIRPRRSVHVGCGWVRIPEGGVWMGVPQVVKKENVVHLGDRGTTLQSLRMASFPVLLFLAATLSPFFPAHGNEQASGALSSALTNLQREILNEHSELRKAGSLTANKLPQMEWSRVRLAKESNWVNQRNYKHSDLEDRKEQKCRYKDTSKNCDTWKKKGFCPRPYSVLCRRTCVCLMKQSLFRYT